MRILAAAVLLAVVSEPSGAACPAANAYSFSWSGQPTAALSYASSYTYTATSPALGTQSFTVGFTANGINANTTIGTLPEITADVNGGVAGNALIMGGAWTGRTASITSNTRVLVTTITFPTPVRDVSFVLHDLDYTLDQFRDWLHIVGRNGPASYVPTITTPHGQANATGPFTAGTSSLKLGPSATSPATLAQEAVGTAANDNNQNGGTLTASFPQPVTSVELRYGNYPYIGATDNSTGQQFYSITSISWCPMPAVTVTKTSTALSDPVNGTTNPKLVPGADLSYTLTVANANTSPVDLSSTVLTDVLPGEVTFFNGDIDGGGPLAGNFEFTPGTSGLSFAAGNLSYSNDGGASYAYTPATGYDAAVSALRFAPTGAMAANSSFSIRFRAQIK